MGAQRSSFAKLQRDRAKKAKAAAKREKRLERDDSPETEETAAPLPSGGGELSAAELLDLVERLHKQYESKAIDLDTFEEQKAELMARLPID
jgi:hypothetical protein